MGSVLTLCRPALRASLGGLIALTLATSTASAQEAPQSLAELLRINDDTYAFRSGGYVSMFITTDSGVVVVDPIGGGQNAGNPAALKAAIASVISEPVRYMIYSHAAQDHGTGGVVFADTAEFVAHSNAVTALTERNDPRTPVPTITFDDQFDLDIGGKTVELDWAAASLGDDYLTVRYRNVLMIVDNMRVKQLPFGDLGGQPDRYVDLIERVEADPGWEWFIYGHAVGREALGTRDDMREHREYVRDLEAAVRSARAAGLADNSDGMVTAVLTTLEPRYGAWSAFNPQRMAQNVSGMVRFLAGQLGQ
ncbi:MAG: putative Metallo-beta-lactamase family protein [Chloroflexi bacterium]|nr:putative Metallo-beta-lactamase family protein [Chloroflexota bacterium]